MYIKKILKQIIILVFVAAIVFFLFYNCSGNNSESSSDDSSKKTNTSNTPSYINECYKLYLEALKQDSIIMLADEVNLNVANAAIKAFSDFSFYCKSDTLAPVFLLKAGQIAMSVNNIPQAQLSFERVLKDFPDFKNRGAAMFLLAQMYDEPQYLNDELRAKELYDRIISTFPGTDWARNADAARSLLGKSDEEIAHEFLRKTKNHK